MVILNSMKFELKSMQCRCILKNAIPEISLYNNSGIHILINCYFNNLCCIVIQDEVNILNVRFFLISILENHLIRFVLHLWKMENTREKQQQEHVDKAEKNRVINKQ